MDDILEGHLQKLVKGVQHSIKSFKADIKNPNDEDGYSIEVVADKNGDSIDSVFATLASASRHYIDFVKASVDDVMCDGKTLDEAIMHTHKILHDNNTFKSFIEAVTVTNDITFNFPENPTAQTINIINNMALLALRIPLLWPYSDEIASFLNTVPYTTSMVACLDKDKGLALVETAYAEAAPYDGHIFYDWVPDMLAEMDMALLVSQGLEKPPGLRQKIPLQYRLH